MAQDTLGIITPHPPIMVPEVGGERAGVTRASSEAMATAARLLERFDPETVVIMSPHAPTAADAFLVDTAAQVGGDLGGFAAPQMAIRAAGDPPLALAIIEEAEKRDVPVFDRAGSARLDSGELDHGVLVPMSFLDRAGRLPLVVLSLSFLPYRLHTLFGQAVAAAAERLGRRVAFVASGDMSHRLLPGAPAGYSAEAKLFDAEVVRLLEAGDYAGLSEIDPGLVETAGECGLRSLITLGGFIEGGGLTTHLLAYEGPWGVGYLTGVVGGADLMAGLPPAVIDTTAAGGRKGGMPGDDESEPVALARRTIDTYVRYGVDVDLPAPTDPLLSSRAGAFVSLHSTGDLRGCLGTILPTRDTLAHEIVHNAIQAATCDPRFPPISIEELDDLDISVDVLHAPEPVADLHELDPSAYGVIVTSGFRRGLLLPDLEGVVTPEQQVAISMQKAGIRAGEPIELERFKVDRYH